MAATRSRSLAQSARGEKGGNAAMTAGEAIEALRVLAHEAGA
jgi:hypothetical protein